MTLLAIVLTIPLVVSSPCIGSTRYLVYSTLNKVSNCSGDKKSFYCAYIFYIGFNAEFKLALGFVIDDSRVHWINCTSVSFDL